MSGGSSGADPYYRPPKPQTEHAYAQPKRIVVTPSGKRVFYYNCSGCGREFSRGRHRPSQKKYCGNECRNKAFGALGTAKKGQPRTDAERKNMSEGQRAAWAVPEIRRKRIESMKGTKKRKPTKRKKSTARTYSYTCTGCGKFFTTPRKRTGKNKFHSAECRNKWQSTQKKGENVRCANPKCKNEFYRRASRPERKYCSMDCAKTDPAYWQKVGDTRKKRYQRNWEWEGWKEKRTDRAFWDPIAAAVREKDRHQCQGCGSKWKRGEKRYHVHHIIPRSLGGYDEFWNLITLCPSCHRKADAKGGAIKYPVEPQTKLPDFDEFNN